MSQPVAYRYIIVDIDAPVATITLNRPEVLNACNPATHQEVQDAIEQVPVNESLIRQRAADAATVQADAALLRARVHAQVFQVLTPDQQAKGKELRQKAEQRMQHGWQQRQQRQKPGAAPRQ